MNVKNILIACAVSLLLLGTTIHCQSLDVDRSTLEEHGPATSSKSKVPRIMSLHIRSDIVYRFATTLVSSRVVNEDTQAREVGFEVVLPNEAFISNFTLEIDGQVYPGDVKEKEAAKKQYEKAKQKGQSAGHISARPRQTNRFKVAINVAGDNDITFNLTYTEVLRRTRGVYEHKIYVDPKQIVDDLVVEVLIWESREITTLRIPPLRNDLLTEVDITAYNELADVQRPTNKSAYIRYAPTTWEQRQASENGISGLFVVEYDVARDFDTGDVLVANGYFVHFFAPKGLQPLRKRMLFVLDTSGSMMGRKIRQLKSAMIDILDNLEEDDMFNIITFSWNSNPWSKRLQEATPANIEAAKIYIKNLIARGGTNINDAVLDGMTSLSDIHQQDMDPQAAPLIVFLTDGEATSGETQTERILENIKTKNMMSIPIFSLSFGDNADFKFLRKLGSQNNAFARKIYEGSDASLQLTGFYDEIATVLLSNVTFNYVDDSVDDTTVTESTFPNFFNGTELIVSGRLMDNSIDSLQISVVGNGIDGSIDLSSSEGFDLSDFQTRPEFQTSADFATITEKLWAYLTIKQLLNNILRAENATLKDELKQRITDLALKYNFVTPMTSMVVTKPDEADDINTTEDGLEDNEQDSKTSTGQSSLGRRLPQALTAGLRSAPGLADSDPHFIVNVGGLEEAVCFDVMGNTGDVIMLVRDIETDVTVNAVMMSDDVSKRKKRKKNKKRNRKQAKSDSATEEASKTYLGSVTILNRQMKMVVTPDKIKLNDRPIPWRNETAVLLNGNRIVIDANGQMVAVIFPNRITLLVMRHMRSRQQLRAGRINYLGFYIVDERGFSNRTHGLLGQFLQRYVTLETTRARNGRTIGRLSVGGNTKKQRKVTASLGKRHNMATNTTKPCWMVQRNGRGLIDGTYTDYVVDHVRV